MPRGRDGLYRRENDVLAFRYKDESGTWREKYTGETDRKKARDFRADFLRDLENRNLPTEMADWRLDQAREWWLEYRKPLVAEGTLAPETYRLKPLERILGNKRLRGITSADLDRYTSARLGEGVGAWSVNKEVMAWSQILKKAKLWHRLSSDYKPLRIKASDIGRALTRDELRELAQKASSNLDWEAAFYGSVLAANTGLRGGEIKRLRLTSIDLEKRRLRVARADAKTDASARVVELNRDATEAAVRLLIRAREHGAVKPEHYLLPKQLSRIQHGPHKGERGYDAHQHQQYWDTAWKSLTSAVCCPACGELQDPADHCRNESCAGRMKGLKSPTEGLRFHDLRHTFITHMVELGVPLGVIQTFVGHISARMVRHYTHISSGAARKAVELLDANPILPASGTEMMRTERIQ